MKNKDQLGLNFIQDNIKHLVNQINCFFCKGELLIISIAIIVAITMSGQVENADKWVSNLIQNNIKYLVNQTNYFCYRSELLIILIGIIVAINMIIKYKKDWSYIYEISKCLKTSLFIILLAYLIKALNIKTIMPIFDVTFYNLMPITIIVTFIGYLLDRYLFYKVLNEHSKYKINIRFIKYTIMITYVFLLVSSLYSVKDIILPFIWQVNLVSIMYSEYLKNTEKTKVRNLYATRNAQLSVLKDIIKQTDYEDYGISINGNWGSGKSELFSALISDCKKDKKYCIYIKPMISDSQERLIKEFQKSLSKLMKEHGIYSGRNSSIDKYFSEILKLIEFNKRVTLFDFMDLIKEERSYKELKKELQEDINALLFKNNKESDKDKDPYDRLIVIIDDFDRMEENNQLEILSFIKEVIDFDGCVTIIALDYENLKENTIVNPVYLEKFIATQIPLVDVDFEEIIKFHAKEILNISGLNPFSQNILNEINGNIYNYYSKIESRLNLYISSKENSTYINEFKSFCVERRININNSRRIKHFLSDIKNTVLLIDRLYKSSDDRKELLTTVNVSELVYFFNYLKIFNNESYREIIRLNGVVEYIECLDRKVNNMAGKYFNAILGDLIPEKVDKKDYEFQEIKDLERTNTLNFIKDIFINYYFTMNNINLLIDSQKNLKLIDDKELDIKDCYLETLSLYQKNIFKDRENEKKTVERTEYFIGYLEGLFNENKISIKDILQLTEKVNVDYMKYYLKTVYKLIDENIAKTEYSLKIDLIKPYLDKLEKENIMFNLSGFSKLMILATTEKNEDYDETEIYKLFNDLFSTEELFNRIKKYTLCNKIINDCNELTNIRQITDALINTIDFSKFIFISRESLVESLDKFIINSEHISKFINFKHSVIEADKYKEISTNITNYNIDEITKIIEDLYKEEQINNNMKSIFENLVEHIVNKKQIEKLNYECKNNIKSLCSKILDEKQSINYNFDMLLNVERILNYKDQNMESK